MAGNAYSQTMAYGLVVWEEVVLGGEATKAELAARLNMERHRVNLAVDTMIESGWLRNGDGVIKLGDRPIYCLTQLERRLRATAVQLIAQADALRDCLPQRLAPPAPIIEWTAERIIELRGKLGLSQREAAEQWGIPRTTLSMIELGKRPIDDGLADKLDTVASGHKDVAE